MVVTLRLDESALLKLSVKRPVALRKLAEEHSRPHSRRGGVGAPQLPVKWPIALRKPSVKRRVALRKALRAMLCRSR